MADEPSRIQRSECKWVFVVAAGVVALASLPYVVVYLATPPDLRFVGVLINPLDGNSYLAKMQIGAQGGWLFHLPYSALEHPGALLFSFHILLGHIAAWTRLPIPLMYHLTRIIAGFAVLLSVYELVTRVTQDRAERRIAFLDRLARLNETQQGPVAVDGCRPDTQVLRADTVPAPVVASPHGGLHGRAVRKPLGRHVARIGRNLAVGPEEQHEDIR